MIAGPGDGFELGFGSLPIGSDLRWVCSVTMLGVVRRCVASRWRDLVVTFMTANLPKNSNASMGSLA